MSVSFNTKHLTPFIKEDEFAAIYPQVAAAHEQLEAKTARQRLFGLDVSAPRLR